MKKLILILVVLIASASYGANNPRLSHELNKKLKFDLRDIELDTDHQDFVVVHFYICNDKIEISTILGTQQQLIQKVIVKLSLLQIEVEYDEEKLYRCKITFEKI